MYSFEKNKGLTETPLCLKFGCLDLRKWEGCIIILLWNAMMHLVEVWKKKWDLSFLFLFFLFLSLPSPVIQRTQRQRFLRETASTSSFITMLLGPSPYVPSSMSLPTRNSYNPSMILTRVHLFPTPVSSCLFTVTSYAPSQTIFSFIFNIYIY